MRESRIDITLVRSAHMESRGEHNSIRLPKKIRTTAAPKRKSISVLGRKLYIKQAFKSDIANIKNEYKTKKVPIVGFVSEQTFSKLCAKDTKEHKAWISEASEPLMIGCDPEFVFVNKDSKLPKKSMLFM